MATGDSLAYVGAGRGVPLPPRPTTRAAHKRWCTACKRTLDDPTLLDDQDRCPRCARIAAVKAEAEAAERRAAQAAAHEAKHTSQDEPPAAQHPSTHTTRRRPNKPTARPTTTPKPAPKPRSRFDVDEAMRRYTNGEPAATIANDLGVTTTAIYTHASRRGIRAGRAQRRDKIQLPEPDITSAYLAGASLADLATQHGVSAPTIARHLEHHGITRRKQRVDYTAELLEQVRTRYIDHGMTQTEVAADLNISTKVVQNAMERGNIPARDSASARSAAGIGHPIKIQPSDHADIIQRYQQGESAPSIARTYSASSTSIYAVLRKHGVTDRHRARTLAGPGVDRSKHLRARIADLGVTPRAIKDWALTQGLIERITRGFPPMRLVEAYAAAHTTEGENAA